MKTSFTIKTRTLPELTFHGDWTARTAPSMDHPGDPMEVDLEMIDCGGDPVPEGLWEFLLDCYWDDLCEAVDEAYDARFDEPRR